jgi:autotransporter translocation and assembly factor TamB
VLSIEQLELRGPATVDLSGTIPIGAGAVNLSLRAPEQDLGFLTSFLPGGPVNGVFSLDLDARGDTNDIAFEIDLSAVVQDPAAGLGSWPVDVLGAAPAGPARLDIRARQTIDGIEIDQLLIESDSALVSGQGSIPLRWNPDHGLTAEPLDRTFDLGFRVTAPGPKGMNLPVVAEGQVRIGADRTQVQDLDLTAGPGRAAGFVTTDAGWMDWLSGDPGTKAVSGELTLEDFSLAILPADALGLGVLEGNLSGRADLTGTIERPEPRIEVDISNVAVRAGSLPRLEDVAAHLSVLPDQVRLENLSGSMGAGPFGGALVVRASGGNLWDSPAETSITGNFWGKDLLVANERNLRLRSNVDLQLRGTAEELVVGGSVRITSGRYARRLTLLPDLRARGGTAAALEEFQLLPIDSALGQRIHFDIEIATDRDFEVRTHFLDCDLVLDLRLRGQASLARLEGVVSSSAGILRLPGTTLRLDSALVTFPQDRPMQPELVANASGRRHGIQIQLNAHGPLQELEIDVSSIPVFAPQELWTLVTTGVLPQTLRSRGLEGQAALVGGYLAEELAAWYSGDSMEDTTSFFDRFTFVAGRDISESGQESLVVEFSLSELFYLQGERDVYENYNGGIVIRWRF